MATKLSHKVLGVGFSGFVCLIHEIIGAISKLGTEWFSARRRQHNNYCSSFALCGSEQSTNCYCF